MLWLSVDWLADATVEEPGIDLEDVYRYGLLVGHPPSLPTLDYPWLLCPMLLSIGFLPKRDLPK